MANREHEALIKSGVDRWNLWRSENPEIRPDLSAVDFSRKTNTVLKYANLADCDLHAADLNFAYLKGTELVRANLQGAKCENVTFSHSDLTEAQCQYAFLSRANFFRAKCCRTRFDGCQLGGASLVETDVTDAVFDKCPVYGISAWNLIGVPRSQKGLIVTPKKEPVVEVDDIQMAQFVFLLLQHANLRRVINSVTERGVLLLGRFGGGGIDLLRSVAERLREWGYVPIIFDFERPRDRTFTETVKTLVGLSRFVIVDLSGPSVPAELSSTVPDFKLPFVPVLERGRQAYSMFADLLLNDWVIRPVVEFASPDELLSKLRAEVVAPAEARVRHRQQLLDEVFRR
jgi:hypothetical protein